MFEWRRQGLYSTTNIETGGAAFLRAYINTNQWNDLEMSNLFKKEQILVMLWSVQKWQWTGDSVDQSRISLLVKVIEF